MSKKCFCIVKEFKKESFHKKFQKKYVLWDTIDPFITGSVGKVYKKLETLVDELDFKEIEVISFETRSLGSNLNVRELKNGKFFFKIEWQNLGNSEIEEVLRLIALKNA